MFENMKKPATFKKGQPSLGLNAFLQRMQDNGYEFLTQVTVFTGNRTVLLQSEELSISLPCEIGINGFAEYDQSFEGDKKTPLCETKVRHIDLPIQDINNEIASAISKTTESSISFGPCFICLYITVPNTEKVRGIGFHGCDDDSDGVLRPTDGCIRMFNADLLLIRKLFYKNLKILIKHG